MSLYRTTSQSYNELANQKPHEDSKFYSDFARDWLQYQMGEHAADNADARTRMLYNDLYSPQAQMDQLKQAGLSPSIYASGGIAGKSGVSGEMGTRGSSSTGGSQQLTSMFSALTQATQIAAQVSKTKAETNLIKAQTANLDQDTENKVEQKGLITAQIAQTLQNTKYQNVATTALETQNAIDQYTLKLEQYKWDEGFTIEMLESEATKMYNESKISEEQWKLINNERIISDQTIKIQIQTICEQYSNLVQDTLNKTADFYLTQAQSKKLTEDILVNWYQAKVYKLSEEAQIKWMKSQLSIELAKLNLGKYGVDMNTHSLFNQANTSTINSVLSTLGNITGMLLLSRFGKGVNKAATTNGITTPVTYPYNTEQYY